MENKKYKNYIVLNTFELKGLTPAYVALQPRTNKFNDKLEYVDSFKWDESNLKQIEYSLSGMGLSGEARTETVNKFFKSNSKSEKVIYFIHDKPTIKANLYNVYCTLTNYDLLVGPEYINMFKLAVSGVQPLLNYEDREEDNVQTNS